MFRTIAGESGDYATTLPNQIMLSGDCSSFDDANWWQLHEFNHVFNQWNTGRLTQANYLPNRKKWEDESDQFADSKLGEFQKCLTEGCKCAKQ